MNWKHSISHKNMIKNQKSTTEKRKNYYTNDNAWINKRSINEWTNVYERMNEWKKERKESGNKVEKSSIKWKKRKTNFPLFFFRDMYKKTRLFTEREKIYFSQNDFNVDQRKKRRNCATANNERHEKKSPQSRYGHE